MLAKSSVRVHFNILRSFARLSTQEKAASYRLFDIYRFNPAKDIKPHMERYAVDVSKYESIHMSMVDAIT